MTTLDITNECLAIGKKISRLTGVHSVRTAGFSVQKYGESIWPLAMPGQMTRNVSNNIATFQEQIAAGMPHRGYFSVTVKPEEALAVSEKVQRKAGAILAYTNVSGSKVEMFFIKTEAAPEIVKFSNWDGRQFAEGAVHGKEGAKRYRVRKTLNGRNQGAFSARESGEDWIHIDSAGRAWQCASWPLPNGMGNLTIVHVDEPFEANDNDGLITEAAAKRLAAVCNANFSGRTEFVQMLLIGYTGVYKCAAEVLRGEPRAGQAELLASVPDADIFIGAAGASRKVWLEKSSLGRITLWNAPRREQNFVSADALQTFLRWQAYFETDVILGVGSAMMRAQLREDQIAALTTPLQELQEECEEQGESEYDYRPEHKADAWRIADAAENRVGRIARMVNRSPFAWKDAIGFRHSRVARMLQSMARANSGFRNAGEGMPAWVIPGKYMMLMHHDFAGVKQPRRGWARIVKNRGRHYGYSINPEDFATREWVEESDHSDFDDKSTLTPAVDPETGETYAVILRRPSSLPYGGSIRRTPKADLREWNRSKGIPVLPLRPDWKERAAVAAQYIDLPVGISTGPERVPQPATNDLEAELGANIWAAQQVREVGLASLIIGAIALSGLSDEKSKFITSDLIDNSVNQTHNGEYVTSQLMDRLVDLIHQGKRFYMPALSKIKKPVEQAYAKKYGRKPVIRQGTFPEHRKVWKHLVKEAQAAKTMSDTLAMRANGIPNHLVEPLDPELYRIAIKVAHAVANYWQQWGVRAGEIRRSNRDYEEKDAELSHRTAETNSMIAERVQAGLAEARQSPNFYIPGNFARALWQTQLTEARRWQKGKSYNLVGLLDEEELEGFFDPTWYGKADPTWVSRVTLTKGSALQPGDQCQIKKHGTKWAVLKDDQIVAVLESEGYGLAGLKSEFIGFIPVPEETPKGFHCRQAVAVFRNDQEEIIDATRRLLKEQEAIVRSFHVLD